ncbi:neprilysin-1-like [Dermacentor variabilis]|uniref:neprilysin-1-like n=1 Tax=Dermacentor variabilis TaxID=34621 RepID=UPI003F5B3083
MSRNSTMMSAFSALSMGSTRRRRQRQQTEEPELSFGDLIPALPVDDSNRWTFKRYIILCASVAAVLSLLTVSVSVTTVAVKKTVSKRSHIVDDDKPEHIQRHRSAFSCSSNACVREAQRITQSLNKSSEVGPCEDFYTYTCQGWLSDNPVVAGAARTSYSLEIKERVEAGMMSFIEAETTGPVGAETPHNMSIIKKLVNFIRGCEQKENMVDVGVRPLKRVLADLSLRTWPSVRATEPAVEFVAGLVARALGESTVFSVSYGPDLANRSRNIITVDQPTLSIRRGHLLGNPRNLESYRIIVKQAMALTKPQEQLDGLAGDVMNLVHRIARSTKTTKERMKIGSHFLRERLDSLQAKTRWHWAKFLNTVFDGVTSVNDMHYIRVKTPFYVGHMSRILNTVSSATVFNYVGFRVVLALSPLLSEESAKEVARLRLRRRFESHGEAASRQRVCLHLAEDAMPLVVLHVYAVVFNKVYVPSIEKVIYSVESIRYFMKAFVEQAHWMEHSSKMAARYKLKTMSLNIFYPLWIMDTDKLARIYSSTMVNRKEIAESYYLLRRATMHRYWSKFSKDQAEPEWQGSAFDLECRYDCEANALYIPMGLFSEPILHSDVSAIFSISRPGARIAHAMLGAIDKRGFLYTVSSTYRKWWTEETHYRYAQVLSCFMEQYKGIVDRKLHLRLTSSGTSEMNVADNAAPEVLFEAFRQTVDDMDIDNRRFSMSGLNKFTLDQLFFISYAMGFCEEQKEDFLRKQILHGTTSPAKYRVNLPFSNMPSFAKAFGCSEDSPMNRTLRCTFW